MSGQAIILSGGPMDGLDPPTRIHIVKPDDPRSDYTWARANYRRRDIQQIGSEFEVWDYVEEDE